MKPFRLLTLSLVLLCTPAVHGQDAAKIAEQKRVVAELERKIAEEEKQIANLRSGKRRTEEDVRRLNRQIENRSRLLNETEREASQLQLNLVYTDSVATQLAAQLAQLRAQYAAAVRDAYRNYRHHNYLTYIFSSHSVQEIARRIVNLRELAASRKEQVARIDSLTVQVQREKELLEQRHRSLDSVSRQLTQQRSSLERDAKEARSSLQQLSSREKSALQRKLQQEEQLQTAVAELRKLTKGNKEGASFTAKTSGLHLPVAGGKVKRYKGNMAEITGPRGAAVRSIYEGKIVDVKQNRITGKYEVYVAHGEYITTYSNLSAVSVAKGGKITRDGVLGTIGSAMDVSTMATEYKIVFGIYPPNPNTKMLASDCFKK